MAAEKYVLDKGFEPEAFLADIRAAREAVGEATEADARHLQGLVSAVQLFWLIGHGLLLLSVARPLGATTLLGCVAAAALISTSRCMRWTIIGHHVSHGGYDKLQKNKPGALADHYKRGTFAIGGRRFLDWLDWMLPQAWDVEHNKLHHYYLSEDKDPDLVERNFELLQKMPLPKALKYASMLMWIVSWKATYYSTNTFKELQLSRKGSWLARHWPACWPASEPLTVFQFLQGPLCCLMRGEPGAVLFWFAFMAQWVLMILPMLALVVSPVLPPLLLGTAGAWPFALPFKTAAWRALAVAALAEALTNAHSFVIILCNHSGGDLYSYSTSCKAYTAEWFLRCAYSSANFETGNDLVDGMYGWLNYQVEHHMFPDLTPLQYRKLQPLVKGVLAKHGALYVQQNALLRTWKMLRVAVGSDSMKKCTAILPPQKSSSAEIVKDQSMGG